MRGMPAWLALLFAMVPALGWTGSMPHRDGFWPFYYDSDEDRLFLDVEPARLGEEFIYLRSLSTGLGMVAPRPLRGIDRATMEGEREALVHFEKHGRRILLIQRNLAFRSLDPKQPALARAVEESFATSVLGVFPIVAEKNGQLRADATDFFLQDAWDVQRLVREAGEGNVHVDRDRSTFHMPGTKAFPRNLEVDVLVTFAGEQFGAALSRHVPDGRSFSLRQHHSFVALPEPGYRPRPYDPRLAFMWMRFLDYSRPFPQGYERRWLIRYRLEKSDPSAAVSAPVRPIVFYLDRAMPEPIRSAYREGAIWWNKALEGAGFRDALLIQDLPADIDPMDARYNVIVYTFNSGADVGTGPSIIDPRTGEMIRSVVRIDSHRSLLYANLYAGLAPALNSTSLGVERLTHSWLSWHGAHEVGHALGIPDMNYVGSDGRPNSIGTLPAPLITLDAQNKIDVSDPIREGPGEFDMLAIRYGYTPFAEAEEQAGLGAIVDEAIKKGIRSPTDYVSALPRASAFVNGRDLIAELRRVMNVRAVMLSSLDESAIGVGDPLWRSHERLFPLYLYHQPTLEAVIKFIGGMDYTYAVRGDGQEATSIVDPGLQRQALDAVLGALTPSSLEIPERIIAMIPPRTWQEDDDPSYTPRYFSMPAAPAFDPLAAARMLAQRVVDSLLNRERLARLVSFHARHSRNPAVSEVLGKLVAAVWVQDADASSMHGALLNVTRQAVLDGLVGLAGDAQAVAEARMAARWQLVRLAGRLRALNSPASAEEAALNAEAIRRIDQWAQGSR